jgi:hypothetical protein
MKTSTKVFIGAGAAGVLGLLLWKYPLKKSTKEPITTRPAETNLFGSSPYGTSARRASASSPAVAASYPSNLRAAGAWVIE